MSTPWNILVVEDNADDAYFMRRALRTAAPAALCDFVADGQSALDYLHATGAHADRAGKALPDVVFLDLKLPYVYGQDVLAAIRATPRTATLPVIVLTSSGEERDHSATTALGIVAYLVKPPRPAIVAEALGKLAARTTPPSQPAPDPCPRP